MLRKLIRLGRPLPALIASLILLTVLALGVGPVPALGSVLTPGGGVWNSAADGEPVHDETLAIPGLAHPVAVSFDADGVPTVRAASDEDLFRAQGYLQARFRLTQLDLERRMASGRLSELVGAGALDSDKFELQMGLLRTARAEWARTSAGSQVGRALTAYAQGVNDRIAELRRSGQWPAVFALAGVRPSDWSPVDSLAVQELLTQDMDYTTAPLDYAILERSLGAQRTMAWFPVVAPDAQSPYDPGPYRNLGVAPLDLAANANADVPAGGTSQGPVQASSQGTATTASTQVAAATAVSAADILRRTSRLPAATHHTFPDSNAWAANGPAVSGGTALLAGDPHLQLTLPSYWYQMVLSSPQTQVTGASMVGLPGILIGRNAAISWSLTNVQNQSTLFYTERTSPAHPGQYFWNGAWRAMRRVSYTIPVHGAAPVDFTVDLTVHGPVMTQAGQTTSVDWMGDIPSADESVVLAVDKAADFAQFRSALADWHAPTLNFAYADGAGHIGVVAAGYFPLTKAGQPWLPLPGTGEDDVTGTVPFAAAPQSYDPPTHVVVTANQRPVSAAYPYYIGTSLDCFDNGYRADTLQQYLSTHSGMTAAQFKALQSDLTDHLATLVVPALRAALAGDAALSPAERQALAQLAGWDDKMTADSAAPTVWWTFWNDYLSTVFQPWWKATKVPTAKDPGGLEVSASLPSLAEDLEQWTLSDQHNPVFSPPGGPSGTAADAMRTAFGKAVKELGSRLGGEPASWTWGRIHARRIPALTGAPALGYGPQPAGGDPWTVNAADGGLTSSFGPSWRMVVDWTAERTGTAEAVYPGGQSENPVSPWYQNLIPYWWTGRLLPLRMPTDPAAPTTAQWTLRPGA